MKEKNNNNNETKGQRIEGRGKKQNGLFIIVNVIAIQLNEFIYFIFQTAARTSGIKGNRAPLGNISYRKKKKYINHGIIL